MDGSEQSAKNVDKIFHEFPLVFKQKSNIIIQDGWEFDEGWMPLFKQALQEVQTILESTPCPEFMITQTKSKFGSITIYTSDSTPEIDQIFQELEEKTKSICESCGEPGTLRKNALNYITLCEECNKRKK